MAYSISSKGYRVYNKRNIVIKESMNVVFDESNNSCLRNNDEDQIRLDKQTNTND